MGRNFCVTAVYASAVCSYLILLHCTGHMQMLVGLHESYSCQGIDADTGQLLAPDTIVLNSDLIMISTPRVIPRQIGEIF